MHTIKTRNFNASRLGLRLLNLSMLAGVQRQDSPDGDCKFYLSTASSFKAWGLWLYFMACRNLSGGWTYIVRPGQELGGGYKSIY